MKKLGIILALVMMTWVALAQDAEQSAAEAPSPGERSFGVVIYAEGEIVSVIRDGRRTEYDAFTGELIGFAVYPGDIIQTEQATYLELQLLPSHSVVKVAENTSFLVEHIGVAGEGVFNLSYGRLRARVERLTSQGPFEIRGIGATAGVRGTDFGTDVVLRPSGGAAVTRVYSFDGEILVELAGQPSGTEPIVVSANQMITATTLTPHCRNRCRHRTWSQRLRSCCRT